MKTQTTYIPETIAELDELVKARLVHLIDLRKLPERDVFKYVIDSRNLDLADWWAGKMVPEERGHHHNSDLRNGDLQYVYDYIPMNRGRFVMCLAEAVSHVKGKSPRFVDAGAGPGYKVMLAGCVFRGLGIHGYTADGIELDPEFVVIGRHTLSCYVNRGDITKAHYNSYNLIYAYNPIVSDEGMKRFFWRILETAKPETICLFFNVCSGEHALEKINSDKPFGKYFENISPHIWRVK